ncbi:VOC family protein [Paracoccaceae bacterium]|nr:VOC family protein [Paracoccaceae bacterium]
MQAILQSQGIHHITLNGADRKTSVDFWQGVLGMKLIFEQPNLDDETETHLYFDCGDGRTVTVFTNETRRGMIEMPKNSIGSVHHLAFWVSQSTLRIADKKLKKRGIDSSGIKDRGFMDSIYFRDPLGLLIELACYKFEPPFSFTHGQVLEKAHELRLARGVKNIEDEDISNSLVILSEKSIR